MVNKPCGALCGMLPTQCFYGVADKRCCVLLTQCSFRVADERCGVLLTQCSYRVANQPCVNTGDFTMWAINCIVFMLFVVNMACFHCVVY